jgi:hypothetical protein
MAAAVEGTGSSTINVDHEATTAEGMDSVEVPVKVYIEVIVRRSATFVRSQIAGQLGTLLMSEGRHIISFDRAQETLAIMRLRQPISKAS